MSVSFVYNLFNAFKKMKSINLSFHFKFRLYLTFALAKASPELSRPESEHFSITKCTTIEVQPEGIRKPNHQACLSTVSEAKKLQ